MVSDLLGLRPLETIENRSLPGLSESWLLVSTTFLKGTIRDFLFGFSLAGTLYSFLHIFFKMFLFSYPK